MLRIFSLTGLFVSAASARGCLNGKYPKLHGKFQGPSTELEQDTSSDGYAKKDKSNPFVLTQSEVYHEYVGQSKEFPDFFTITRYDFDQDEHVSKEYSLCAWKEPTGKEKTAYEFFCVDGYNNGELEVTNRNFVATVNNHCVVTGLQMYESDNMGTPDVQKALLKPVKKFTIVYGDGVNLWPQHGYKKGGDASHAKSTYKKDHYEPKKDHFKPKKDHYEPKKDHHKPKNDKYEPKKDHYEPKNDKYEPKKDHYEPKNDKYEPTKDHYKPTNDKYEPKKDHYEPKNDKYEPTKDHYKPTNDKYEPKNDHYEPKKDFHKPMNDKYEPKNDHYEPEPVYYDPEPVYYDPEPVYYDPEPVYNDPEPVYYDEPYYAEPEPYYAEPEPYYAESDYADLTY